MTDAQRRALSQLAAAPAGRCPTSTTTDGRYVSGVCAAGLIRRGWARRVCTERASNGVPISFEVEITDAGRVALETQGAR